MTADTWMRCGGMRIVLPERGTFYLALNPPPDFPFKPAAWVDHKVLRIHAASELLEITSETNMRISQVPAAAVTALPPLQIRRTSSFLYSVHFPASCACSSMCPSSRLSSLSYSTMFSPLIRTRQVASFTRIWRSHHSPA